MSEIPLLGQGKPESAEPEVMKLRTAFVVFQDPETGQWGASNDPQLLADRIELAAVASPGSMSQGAKEVAEDILAQKVAGVVHGLMMQAAAQAQQAASEAALRQRLKV